MQAPLSKLEPLAPATPGDVLLRGLRCRCPNCGRAKLFRSLIRIHHSCPACGMTLERGDGFYLGPLCINYGLVALCFVTPVLLIGFAEWIPVKTALALALAGTLFLPILLYRFCWSWWLMLYYLCLPDELHANRPEDSDDLSFEEERRS
ncbi:DUF983 domain-containing protein [Coraliomargarita parva]|uniref:DUF983 domain-containing protein n=1 Tax=Coraliomargarita parva TaxID=3014050 RepID=UPI0022B4460A|nr:DUF983 domain-containing protein [Coraliomargarita parva]